MHHLLRLTLVTAAASSLIATATAATEPGQVDFGKLAAPARGQYVEVTLGQGLLKVAGAIARCKDAAAAELIAGLSRVRINVAALDSGNRSLNTERIHELRETLGRQGWETLVTVRGERDEDVAVMIKQRAGEIIEGVVVTVVDERKREAVFINIVGTIRADQLAAVGEQLEIKQLRGHRRERS